MKYRIYIDEVGHADLKASADPDKRFLCLTGVVMRLDYVQKIVQPELEALKAKYFLSHPDEPVILHRKELVYKKGPFTPLKNPELEHNFNNEFLALMASWNYTVIAVIIDKLEHNQNYNDTWKYDPYHYCQEILLERFRLFLKRHNAKGDVMIESRGGKEDMRLKKSFRKLMDNGTNFLKPEELSDFITTKELKVKTKDVNIAGLQLADILAHAVRRYGFINIWDMREEKVTFSDKIIEILENGKFFNHNGKILGYGLKKLP